MQGLKPPWAEMQNDDNFLALAGRMSKLKDVCRGGNLARQDLAWFLGAMLLQGTKGARLYVQELNQSSKSHFHVDMMTFGKYILHHGI